MTNMRKYINDTDKTVKPTTEIIYGIDYVVGTLLKVISNAGHRVDVCVDHTGLFYYQKLHN